MVTNESEFRIALQAVLISVLALYGFWGCAFLVLAIMLPWKPLMAVGGYLAQPVVDWRAQKARERHEKGIAQIEKELDVLLRAPKGPPAAAAPPAPLPSAPAKPSQPISMRPPVPFEPERPARQSWRDIAANVHGLPAAMAIPPAIKDHVRNLPQGVFSNMDLEVEEVKFNGDTAEAYVRFQSPNVTELVIRQRYSLKKSGDHWQVQSRQPANGCGKAAPPSIPVAQPAMRLT